MTAIFEQRSQANYRPEFVTYERIPRCEAIHILQENIHDVAAHVAKKGVAVSVTQATIGEPASLTIRYRLEGVGEMTTTVSVDQVLICDETGYHKETYPATFYRQWRRAE